MFFTCSFRFLSSLSSVFALFLFFSTSAGAQDSSEFDFTGDGLSDVVLVSIDSNDNLDWSTLTSDSAYSSATTISGGTNFGETGDNLIPGHWTSTTTPTIGYVRHANGGVTWTIIDDGEERTMIFGTKGSVLISGGDFDNNGIADAAFIKKNGSVTVKTNPFSGSSANIEMKFSKNQRAKGRAFYLNPDGSGDKLAILYRRNVGGVKRYSLVFQTINRSKTNTRFSGVRRSGLKDVVAIERPNGRDAVLLFTKTSNKQFRVRIQDPLTGSILFTNTYTGNATVLVGNYLTADGEEFAIRDNSGSLTIVNPWSSSETSATNTDGVVADMVNVNTFASNSNSGGSNNNGGNSGGSDGGGGTETGGPAPRSCGRTVDPRDGYKSGNVYKMSDHGGTPVFITHNGARSGNAITRDGQLLERLRYTGLANADGKGLRHHYRMSRSCSSLPSVFYLQIGSTCYEINDRCGRID